MERDHERGNTIIILYPTARRNGAHVTPRLCSATELNYLVIIIEDLIPTNDILTNDHTDYKIITVTEIL